MDEHVNLSSSSGPLIFRYKDLGAFPSVNFKLCIMCHITGSLTMVCFTVFANFVQCRGYGRFILDRKRPDIAQEVLKQYVTFAKCDNVHLQIL